MDLPLGQDFWLTRDRAEGELSDELEIWLHRPKALRYSDGDVTWIAPLDLVDRKATYLGAISVALAKIELGNAVPATQWECLHVARGPRAQI